jgi:predicted MFS family arabinose efflux permease
VRLTQHPRYRFVVAGMAFVSVFAAIGLGRFGYSAILPSMRQTLGLSEAVAGSLNSWNQIGYTIMVLVGGILASRFGTRIVVTIGLIVTAAGMLLTGMAGGLAMIFAGRLITGLGNAMVLAPSIALMAAWFPPSRLGTASAVVPAGSSFALIMVGPVVPRVISAGGEDGWRWAWYFFAAITLVIAVLAFAIQRNHPYAERDVVRSPVCWADIGRIMRSRRAWHLGFLYFCYGLAFLFFFTFFQQRLKDLGYSANTAGILFLILGAGGTLAMTWGRVSDAIGRGNTLAIVMALGAGCALVFAFWHDLIALAVAGGVFGLCGLSVPGLFGAACGDHFGARQAAASLGFVTAFMGVGQTIGPFIGGALADHFNSLTQSYLLSAGVFVIGAGAALFLRDRRAASTPAAMQSAHIREAP